MLGSSACLSCRCYSAMRYVRPRTGSTWMASSARRCRREFSRDRGQDDVAERPPWPNVGAPRAISTMLTIDFMPLGVSARLKMALTLSQAMMPDHLYTLAFALHHPSTPSAGGK